MSSAQMDYDVATESSGVAAVSVRSDDSRRTITSATTYEAAERAVDWLSDQGFPVEHTRIVGTGLRAEHCALPDPGQRGASSASSSAGSWARSPTTR